MQATGSVLRDWMRKSVGEGMACKAQGGLAAGKQNQGHLATVNCLLMHEDK